MRPSLIVLIQSEIEPFPHPPHTLLPLAFSPSFFPVVFFSMLRLLSVSGEGGGLVSFVFSYLLPLKGKLHGIRDFFCFSHYIPVFGT